MTQLSLTQAGLAHSGSSEVVQTCPHEPQLSTLVPVLVHTLPSAPPGQHTSGEGQERIGLFVPCGTGVHVPVAPGSLHASHVPEQAVEQQTPSAQKVLAHCAGRVQVWPLPKVDLQMPAPMSQN